MKKTHASPPTAKTPKKKSKADDIRVTLSKKKNADGSTDIRISGPLAGPLMKHLEEVAKLAGTTVNVAFNVLFAAQMIEMAKGKVNLDKIMEKYPALSAGKGARK